MAVRDNQITIIGNLDRDFEERSTPSGTILATNSVAVNRSYQDKDGEWVENTDWFSITVWAQAAENAIESYSKGDNVIVNGSMRSRKVEKEADGQSIPITYWEINVDHIGACTTRATVGKIERNSKSDSSNNKTGNSSTKSSPAWTDPEPDF